MTKKWFATLSCGLGMVQWEIVEAYTYKEADREARQLCIDFASSYGYEQDYEYFGDYDQLCKEDSWCEEEEEYTDISELDYFVEDYNPEEHGGYL